MFAMECATITRFHVTEHVNMPTIICVALGTNATAIGTIVIKYCNVTMDQTREV